MNSPNSATGPDAAPMPHMMIFAKGQEVRSTDLEKITSADKVEALMRIARAQLQGLSEDAATNDVRTSLTGFIRDAEVRMKKLAQ